MWVIFIFFFVLLFQSNLECEMLWCHFLVTDLDM